MSFSASPFRLSSAPAVAGALLLAAMILVGGVDARTPRGAAEYRERVRLSIDGIPHRVGPWIGVDSEPTRAAVQLLTPNRILQRRYVNPRTGASLSLLIVHCGDVRDMLGHFPPICYKAHGWRPEGAQTVSLDFSDRSAPATVYEFSQTIDLVEQGMSIFNFFVLPSEGSLIVADMDAVERAARESRSAGLGVAQVQIVFSSTMPTDERVAVLKDFLAALEPMVRTIGQGVGK